jgi:hypothetical protein
MNRRRHALTATTTTLAVLATLLAALLLAACGGAKRPGAGDSGPPQHAAAAAAAAYKFSACMRGHGVSSFQDPHISATGNSQQISIRVDPAITSSPDFKSAQKACAHLVPGMNAAGPGANGAGAAQQQAQTEGLVAFAACMRRHGFARFPDPDSQGRLTLTMIQKAGIDLGEPAVRPAADACTAASHGQITKADVTQAIKNPDGSGSQTSQTSQASQASSAG